MGESYRLVILSNRPEDQNGIQVRVCGECGSLVAVGKGHVHEEESEPEQSNDRPVLLRITQQLNDGVSRESMWTLRRGEKQRVNVVATGVSAAGPYRQDVEVELEILS